MNELQIFKQNGWEIRAIEKDGEPWFSAKEVCTALGFKNSRDAISNHLEEFEKDVVRADTPGGEQSISVVNESGLYALIFRSKKKKAREFRVWVTSVVLPEIRKTGKYDIAQNVPKTYAEALRLAADLSEQNEKQKIQLIEQEPKVAFAESVKASNDSISMNDMAKLTKGKIGRNNLFKLLRNRRVLMKNNRPYQAHIKAGHFEVEEVTYRIEGEEKIKFVTRVTSIGQFYILDRIDEWMEA